MRRSIKAFSTGSLDHRNKTTMNGNPSPPPLAGLNYIVSGLCFNSFIKPRHFTKAAPREGFNRRKVPHSEKNFFGTDWEKNRGIIGVLELKRRNFGVSVGESIYIVNDISA